MSPQSTPFDDLPLTATLRHVAEALRDGLLFVDQQGCIDFANEGAERILQRPIADIAGKDISEIVSSLDVAIWSDLIQHAKKVGSAERDIRMRTADGADVAIIVHASLVTGSEQIARGYVVLLRRAMEANDPSVVSARLAAIVESSDDAIVAKSLNGIVTSWNSAAERIFGYKAEEIVGKSILMMIPEDREDEERQILERLRRGDRVDHFQTVRRRKDGKLINVSVTISPIRDATGQIVGASKVARDITDQKEAQDHYQAELEAEVKRRTADFERANKELEGFTYSVSHDLRGPLRTIASSCMIMREDFGAQIPLGAQAELDKQANAAKRMAGLIDDLLKLSRLGRQELRKVDLDITAIATDLSNEMHHGDGIHRYEIEKGMTAFGDAPTIRLLISNLLENATKFSPADTLIRIGQQDGNFFVQDEGIGFDQQYADKIFMPFERLVLESDYPGTGIGLANVKRVVERHGGTAWAVSPGLGKGATFYFALPDKPAEEE